MHRIPHFSHSKNGLILFIIMGLFIMALSSQAQDVTPAATAEATPLVLPTSEVLPTQDAPPPATQESTPPATQDVTVTAQPTAEVILPTQEVTPLPTEDVTAQPTAEATGLPTDEVTPPTQEVPATATAEVTPDAALPLDFYTDFDEAYHPDLSPSTNWTTVDVIDGQALQAETNAVPVLYTRAIFIDAKIQARFLLNTGEGQVILRGYSAGLNADGTLTLYREQVAILTSVVTLPAGEWAVLSLRMLGSEIDVFVNDALVMHYDEPNILPSGSVGFAARSGAVLRVDDFTIYGIPTVLFPDVSPLAPTPLPADTLPLEASLPRPRMVTCNPTLSEITLVTQSGGVQQISDTSLPLAHYALAGDGRYVVFLSADTFGDGSDTNGQADVFRFDRQTCLTQRLTDLIPGLAQTSAAMGAGVAISDNGMVIAFTYTGSDLVAGVSGEQVYVADLTTGSLELISQNGTGTAGNRRARLPALSSDGRYVAFWTDSFNLGPADGNHYCETDGDGDNNDNCPDVYRYDRQTDSVVRVSLSYRNMGPRRSCNWDTCDSLYGAPSLSDDGNVIAFASTAINLVSDDVDLSGCSAACTGQDIFVRNIALGTTTLVSQGSGGQANADSFRPMISGDGRYVLFTSQASNLVADDSNAAADVFLHDIAFNTTSRVSLMTGGAQIPSGVGSITGVAQGAAMSEDARTIAFISLETTASNPTAVAVPSNQPQIFVYDRLAQTIVRGSQSASGTANDAPLFAPLITDDGLSVLFPSESGTLVSGDSNANVDLFLAPLDYPAVLVAPIGVNVSTSGFNATVTWVDPNSSETGYEIERYVAGFAPSIVGTAGENGVFFVENNVGCGLTLWYRVRAVRASDGGVSRWSAWVSVTTLPCVPVCLPDAALQRVNVGTNALLQSAFSTPASGRSLRADGRYILFDAVNPLTGSPSAEADVEDVGAFDVYLYDTLECDLVKVSAADASQDPALETLNSSDAVTVLNTGQALFNSSANNLTNPAAQPMDTNNLSDVFLANPFTGQTEIVSLLTGGSELIGSNVYGVNASANGRYILMSMSAPVPGVTDNNNVADLILYDRVGRTLAVVSMNAFGTETGSGVSGGGHVLTEGPNDSGDVYVVFHSTAANLITDDTNGGCTLPIAPSAACYDVFIRNVTEGHTYRVSVADDESESIGSSYADSAVLVGNTVRVAFTSSATNLVADVTPTTEQIYLRVLPLDNPASGTTELVSRAYTRDHIPGNDRAYGARLSGDGRYVGFTSQADNLVFGDSNGAADAFVHDMLTNGTRRVSLTSADVQLSQPSTLVDVSADGTTILFESAAANLVAGDTANVCEVDLIDTQPTEAGNQYDFNDNCVDLFVVNNPLIAPLPVPTAFTASTTLPDSITLNWGTIMGVTGYIIQTFDAETSTWANLITIPDGTTTTHTLTDLQCGRSIPVRMQSYIETPALRYSAYTPVVVGRTTPCTGLTLVSPIGAALITDTTPELQWALSPDQIATYEVQLSRVATFATLVEGYPREVEGLSLTTDELSDGLYYWRVRVIAPGSGPFTAPAAFTIDATPPAPPALLVPANLAIVRTPRPIFRWSPVIGATRFRLEVTPQGGSPIIDETDIRALLYTPTETLAQGQYSARLWALDAAGNISEFASEIEFTINPALSPAPNAVIVPLGAASSANVAFTWAAGLGGARYTVQVDDNADFSSVEFTCTPTLATALTCTIPSLPLGAYFWRVLREDETPVGTPLPANAFFVSPPAPRAPTLTAPLNAKFLTPSERPTIRLAWDWGTLPVPAGEPFTYEVEVNASSLFNILPVFADETAEQEITIGTLPEGRYFWRVRAANRFGAFGAWSAPFSFLVDNTPPTAPTLLAPGGIIATARPTFAWLAVPGAYRYEIEVNETCGDGSPLHLSTAIITTPGYTIPLTAPALPQGQLQACVRAYDLSQNPSPLSAARPFTVFLGTAPVNGAFIPTVPETNRPILRWTATPGTTDEVITYQVLVDDDSDFSADIFYASRIVPATILGLTIPVTQPMPEGTYFWRVVRFVNDVPQPFIGANIYRVFFMGTLASGPTLTAPIGSMVINTESVTLTWQRPTVADDISISSYEVQVSNSPLFVPLYTQLTVAPAGPTEQVTLTLPALQNGVPFYWRVRAISMGSPVTQWSAAAFIVDNVTPAAPTILAPAANAIVPTVRPIISWAAVPGAAGYNVTITDATTNAVYVDAAPSVTTTYVTPVNLPQTTLIVSVTARDAINTSTASARTFIVRLGTLPALNGMVVTSRPTFTWVAVPGAASYRLQIDDDSTFDSSDDGGDGTMLHDLTLGAVTLYTLSPDEALPNTGLYYWRLSHDGPQGGFPAGGASRLFTFNVPLKPNNAVTRNNLEQEDTIFNASDDAPMTFAWDAVTPAPLFYEVYFSQDSTFNTFYTSITSDDNSYNVTADNEAFPQGVWFWRVRAVYDPTRTSVSPWSDLASFIYDTIAPLAPFSSAPFNAVYDTARPTFGWSAVIGAARYRLTVLDAATMTPLPGLDNVPVAGTSYTIPLSIAALAQNTDAGYVWRVEAEDSAGNRSSGFADRTFTVFLGRFPLFSQPIAVSTPTFLWTGVTGVGAAPWQVEVASDAAMTSLLHVSPPLPAITTRYTLPSAFALPTNTVFYWRVIRESENPNRISGAPFFVVSSLSTITPTPLTPASGEIINDEMLNIGQLVLSWNDIADVVPAEAVFDGYLVELSTSPLFVASTSYVVRETNSTITALGDGLYYWRVRASFGDQSNYGPPSSVRSFRIDQTAPTVPAPISPINTAVITSTRTPTFTWALAGGAATQYVFELDNNDDFSSPIYSRVIAAPVGTPAPTTGAFALPPSEALPNGTYVWRVRAQDAAGNTSGGIARSFTIDLP